jgi:hypothetical protein
VAHAAGLVPMRLRGGGELQEVAGAQEPGLLHLDLLGCSRDWAVAVGARGPGVADEEQHGARQAAQWQLPASIR